MSTPPDPAARNASNGADVLRRLPAQVLAVPLLVYRYGISPMIGPRCRFHPSCSTYSLEALDRFGAMRGTWLAAARLTRCHPWHPGGLDPLPDTFESAAPARYLGSLLRRVRAHTPDESSRPVRDDRPPTPSRP
ncbi:MAG: membrane protein insertion efficiency factor YidD [Burkholderiaceae bacterium]